MPFVAGLLVLLALGFFADSLQAQEPPTEMIHLLENKDPAVRRNTAELLANFPSRVAIQALITVTDDGDESVQKSAKASLNSITGESGADWDRTKWDEWWNTKGMEQFQTGSAEAGVQALRTEMKRRLEDMDKDVRSAKDRANYMLIGGGAVFVVMLLMMIAFAIMGGNRMKGMRELIKQADKYIQDTAAITERTDRIIEELETKKVEIMEFSGKIKDDNIAEMERLSDLQQRNSEHHLREAVMGLREKAEKELNDSLTEMLTGVERKFTRLGDAERDRLGEALEELKVTFQSEVDAHSRFLEANFHHAAGRLEDALRIYRSVLELKPDHYVGWLNKGNVLRDLLRYEEALDAYDRAKELAPSAPSLHFSRATVFARQKLKDAMLEALQLAVAADAEFKDEALNEPAFKEYWDDPAFKDLAEA